MDGCYDVTNISSLGIILHVLSMMIDKGCHLKDISDHYNIWGQIMTIIFNGSVICGHFHIFL